MPIQIKLAPYLRKEINQLPPSEKMQTEKSIQVGNQFSQLFFDGTATSFSPEDTEAWSHIAPLVAVGNEEWSERSRGESRKFWIGGSWLDGNQMVCPHIILFAIRREPEYLVLSYRATVMGMLTISPKKMNMFYTEGQRSHYEVNFELDTHDRVTRIMAPDNSHSPVYTHLTTWMKELIHDPKRRLRTFEDTDTTVSFKIAHYRKIIQQIERQAELICK